MSSYTNNTGVHNDAIGSFVLDKSNGFTQAGIARINDSIRTCVWGILGAQAQTQSSILGKGKAFDAQKQFLANGEDAIYSEVDIPSSIDRYQSILQYARSKVDFVVGFGLYMMPSNVDLFVGTINGHMIIIASDDNIKRIRLGQKNVVNDEPAIVQETFETPREDFALLSDETLPLVDTSQVDTSQVETPQVDSESLKKRIKAR